MDLKISPKKCQLFKTELQYMGNTIFIKDRRVYVTLCILNEIGIISCGALSLCFYLDRKSLNIMSIPLL